VGAYKISIQAWTLERAGDRVYYESDY